MTIDNFEGKYTEDAFIPDMNDMVNHPSHYASGSIECIDAMKAMTNQGRNTKVIISPHVSYLWQVIFKYIWRWAYKDKPIEDLKKARFYLDRMIQEVEQDNES